MTSFPRELAHGFGAVMTLDSSRLLLAFRHSVDADAVAGRIRAFSFLLEDSDAGADRAEPVNHTGRRLWVRSRNGRTIRQDRYRQLVAALETDLDWVGPVYRNGPGNGRHGLVCPLPHVLVIKPASPPDVVRQLQLTRMLAALGFTENREKSAYLGGYQYFQLSDTRGRMAYELRGIVRAERALVDEVHYDSMPMVAPGALRPARRALRSNADGADAAGGEDQHADHRPSLQQLSAT